MIALALETDDAGLLQRLLAGGADPNEVVYSSASAYHRGMTALHAAAERDLRGCCALLVAAGARVDATTNYGCTPLHLARHFHHRKSTRDVIALLLASGADVNAATVSGYTRVDYAVDDGDRALIPLLLRFGGRVNAARARLRYPCNRATNDYVDRIVAGGGWDAHVARHRVRCVGVVCKIAAALPADVASHVAAFWVPPGGF